MIRMNKTISIIFSIIVIIILVVASYVVFLREKEDVTIGIAQWVSNQEYTANLEGFKDGLAERGYIEGENIHFIIENPEADKEKQREVIQSFIDRDVDLIYSLTTPGTLIAKEMVKDKPIVFSIVTFPVEANVIDSLKNSGNNLVGTRNYIPVENQYLLFEKVVPDIKTLAVAHRKGEPNSVIQYIEFKDLLSPRGIDVIDIAAVDLEDLRTQLDTKNEKIDAIYSSCDTLIQAGGEEVVIDHGIHHNKPVFTCNKDGILKGALMGNIADFYAIGKLSGEKAAEILRGVEPSWLTTESPREEYVLINNRTATILGITFSQDVLDLAAEVID